MLLSLNNSLFLFLISAASEIVNCYSPSIILYDNLMVTTLDMSRLGLHAIHRCVYRHVCTENKDCVSEPRKG